MTSRKSPVRDGDAKLSSPAASPAPRTNRNLSVPSIAIQQPSQNLRAHQRSISQQHSRPESKPVAIPAANGAATAAVAGPKPSSPQSLRSVRSRGAIHSRLHRQSGDARADPGQAHSKQSPAETPRRDREARSGDEASKLRNVKPRSLPRNHNASQSTIQGGHTLSRASSSRSSEGGSPVNGSSSETSSSYSGTHRRRGEENHMLFCVDYGFSLALKKDEPPEASRLTMFRNLAANYNKEHGTYHPRMLQLSDQIDGKRWCCMVHDIEKPGPTSSIVLYLKTPMMDTDSDWHGHIETIWRFLEANYRVNINCPHLYMFIGVSLPGYTVNHLVRFVQAAIHFEPVIWAMTPNNQTKRNYDQNPELSVIGQAHASDESSSPAAAITAIEKQCRKMSPTELFKWLFKIFTPDNETAGFNVALGKHLWNIATNVPDDGGGSLYVTLLVPAPLATGGEGEHTGRTNWARFTLSFLRSAMSCLSGAQLKRYKSDAAGLRSFMGGHHKAVFGPSDQGVLDFVAVDSGKPMPEGEF